MRSGIQGLDLVICATTPPVATLYTHCLPAQSHPQPTLCAPFPPPPSPPTHTHAGCQLSLPVHHTTVCHLTRTCARLGPPPPPLPPPTHMGGLLHLPPPHLTRTCARLCPPHTHTHAGGLLCLPRAPVCGRPGQRVPDRPRRLSAAAHATLEVPQPAVAAAQLPQPAVAAAAVWSVQSACACPCLVVVVVCLVVWGPVCSSVCL